jgi:outer membrane protein assembly factor BamB
MVPLVLTLLLGACDTSRVSVTAAAPLLPSMVIPYVAGGNGSTPGGVTALRGRDGTIVWHAATGDPSSHWAPIVRDGVLYTEGGSAQPFTGASVNATLIALRLTDGHVLWQTPMPVGDFGLAVDGTLLLVAAGASGLYALDGSDGAVRWHRAVPLTGEVHAGGGIVVVTRTDYVAPNTFVQSACLAAFRERDGAPLWCSLKWPNAAVAATPTVVIINEGGQLVGALALSTGQFLWEGDAQGSIVAVNDQQVLVSSLQQLAALDAATGHVVWQSTTSVADWVGASWSAAETAVYIADQDEVVALRTGDGRQLWRASYGDYMAMQFVVEGGVLFVLLERQESGPLVRLVAVAADTGTVYWQRDLPDNVLFLADSAANGGTPS